MEHIVIDLYDNVEEGTVTLPIVFPPLIQCYLPISIISNIAVANQKNLNWIMHNFVQLFKYKSIEKIESFPVQYYMYTNQSVINAMEITEEIFPINRINLVQDIIRYIDNQKYVVVYIDESMLPGMRYYKQRPIMHSQFIFGYNKQKGYFKVLNFSNVTQKMDIVDVDFQILEECFYSKRQKELYLQSDKQFVRKKGFQIYVLSYNDEIKFVDNGLNTDILREQIRQYVYSLDSSLTTFYFTGKVEGIWGMNVYDEIAKMFQKNQKIDIRCICLLNEHKKFMQYRLSYLDTILASEYSEIVDISENLWLFSLKSIVHVQELDIEKIITMLRNMRDKEYEILVKLFQ